MKSLSTILLLMVATWATIMHAQTMPQFSPINFEGWTYNNSGTPLSTSNIGNGRIVLYVTSTGKQLMLTSPAFSCQGIDSINATVDWFTKYFSDSNFDINKASLTMVIEDETGSPLDSVTCIPTTRGVSYHSLHLSIAVPQGVSTAQLRFASWTGNVVSNGAVKGIALHASQSGGSSTVVKGDVNGDGIMSIDDVTALIDYLLSNKADSISLEGADIDDDGRISIDDVSTLIDALLNH
ncbi:MAG: dockerin type I repeat-containing protein [Muribaculaceae bacterium]|nr:dockerin type I repeat-containing protein [Muribaculaceae bacterium]